MKKQLSNWEQWKKEREEILQELTDKEREIIEKEIKVEILKIFTKAKNAPDGDDLRFFKYKPIRNIPHVKKWFKIMCVTGDRNIGKTTSAERECRDIVSAGKRFIKLRNIQDEVKECVVSDEEKWLAPNNWSYTNRTSPNIHITGEVENIVGYYRDVNTIGKFKSIEFPDVDLILWDEFNTRVAVKDKFQKFVEFVTTVQRHRKNLSVILQANYVDQNDVMLQKLGVGIEKLDKNEFVKFNWITGSIVILVPKGIYESVGDKKDNLGYRLSLADQKTYQSQYGGGFQPDTIGNVINMAKIANVDPIFNIYYNQYATNDTLGAFKMCLYDAFDKEGKRVLLLTELIEPNKVPIFVFDTFNEIKYPGTVLLEADKLDKIIALWQSEEIKTDSKETHHNITLLFSKAKSIIDKTKFYVEEIGEI